MLGSKINDTLLLRPSLKNILAFVPCLYHFPEPSYYRKCVFHHLGDLDLDLCPTELKKDRLPAFACAYHM